MEDGLVLVENHSGVNGEYGLNPCCNGRWSSTDKKPYRTSDVL